jgi:nitrate/nitrite transporter NarK
MFIQGLTARSAAILGAGFLVMFVGGGSRFAIGLTLKPMVEELGWSRSTLGLAVATFLIVSASCMFFSGRLVDRFGARIVLASGLVIASAGIAAMSIVQTPWQAFLLYGGVFAIGNGIASITPVGVMVSRWFPGRTGFANSLAVSGIGVGQLVMIAALAAVLIQIGWRSVFVWLGIANIVLVPLVIAAIQSRAEDTAPVSAAAPAGMTLRQAAGTRHFWLLIVVYAICGFQDFFVATHVVAFAQDRGVEALLAGNLLAFMGLMGVFGVIITGLWSDRSGPFAATFFCFILRIAIFALILYSQTIVSVAAFALLFGITFWMTAPLTVIFARSAFGLAHLGAVSGIIVMVHHMCGGIGAYIGAALFDAHGNYDIAFMLMLGLSVVAAGVAWPLKQASK